MRFFTPELYVLFNSPDDRIADDAQQRWEEAIDRYRRHLNKLKKTMPKPIKKLAAMSLHDAEVVAFDIPETKDPRALAIAILIVRHAEKVTVITYVDSSIRMVAAKGWPFSKKRKHWLYDEFDARSDHQYVHHILFSDGAVCEILFRCVNVTQFTEHSSLAGDSKKTA